MIAQEELAPIIGANVARMRKRHKLTQTQLAEKIGIHLVHLNRIEKGRALPGVEVLYALADVLGTDADKLRQAS